MDKMNVLILGLLVCGLLSSGYTHPTSQVADDYQGDDYNDDYNDENNGDNQTDELPSALPPSADVTEYTETVHINDNVILHCDVKNLGAQSIVWYNGTILLAHGKHATNNDQRISVTKSLGLEIKNVSVYDSGRYTCQVLPSRLEIHATLKVDNNNPKVVKIIYDNRDVTEKTVVFDPKKGNHEVWLKCAVDASIPDAKVTWTFAGKPLHAQMKDDIAIEEDSLTLLKPSHHNSGVYQCIVNQKSGKVHAAVTVHVKHHPIFPRHRDYVNTAVGSTAELHCDFTADPQPSSVRWFRNDNQKARLYPNEKYEITDGTHGHQNRSTLFIRNVEAGDLTAYHCEVENVIGKASEKVTLGLQPTPAIFEKYDYKRGQVTAVWLVKSVQPLQEMQVLYKTKSSSWKSSPAAPVDISQCAGGECQIVGTMDLPPGEWIVAARSKNTEGWSHSDSSLHTLKIPQDFELTSSSSKVTQMSLLTLLVITLMRLM